MPGLIPGLIVKARARFAASHRILFARTTRLVLLIAGCTALAACVDPYPTEDEPYLDVHSLSLEEKVDALNYLGQSAEPIRRFSLLASCDLQVEEKSGWWSWENAMFKVTETAVLLQSPADGDDQYNLVLSRNGSEMSSVILTGKKRADMHRALLLVRLLQKRCATAG